jgi:hypothetical protein
MVARRVGALVLALLAAWLPATAWLASAAPEVGVAPTAEPGVFEFVATGYKGNEMVSVWLTGPNQEVVPTDHRKVDEKGGIGFTLRLKRHLEPGRWAVTVGGWESGREAIAYFDLLPRPLEINLGVSPSSAAAGATFAFSAIGFEEGERVSYWLTAPDGRAIDGDWLEAGRNGRVAFDWVANDGTPRGRWMMSAYGQKSDRLGVAAFTVE